MKYIYQRVYPKLPMLNRISSFLSQDISSLIYKQTIFPIMDYGSMTGLRLLILGNHKRFCVLYCLLRLYIILVALMNWWIISYVYLVCMTEIYVIRLYCIFPRSKRKLANSFSVFCSSRLE